MSRHAHLTRPADAGLTMEAAVARLRRMHENLRGAPGIELRADRAALRRVLEELDRR